MEQPLGFFARLGLAFSAFFAILGSEVFARSFKRIQENAGALPEPPKPPKIDAPKIEAPKVEAPKPTPKPAPKVDAPDHREALHLLALLQREGRLVDFLQEDISQAGDGDIGAAARVVHEGCRKVFDQYLTFEPIYGDAEGATIVLPKGFDAQKVRLSGNVVGEPPFRGALRHHGWRASDVRLPVVQAELDARIVAPAEVELS